MLPPMATSIEDRFWPKVRQGEGCWEWQASRTSEGYGQISSNGRPVGAHRISWEVHFGEIPDGKCVLHRCDNRSCVRPDHLFLGDRAENNRDTHAKGRWSYNAPGRGRKRRPTGGKKGPQPTPPAERFWLKVDTHGGDVECCWEYLGTRDKYGYGAFWMLELGRKVPSHRIAYSLHYGGFDRSLVVMHTCDNPPCCNPHHLRLGTRGDNNRDRSSKGRGREHRQWGSANTRARLTQSDVDEIRRLANEEITQAEIAERFSIKQPQVSRIIKGTSWPKN